LQIFSATLTTVNLDATLPGICFHNLHHTAANLTLKQGERPKNVQEQVTGEAGKLTEQVQENRLCLIAIFIL